MSRAARILKKQGIEQAGSGAGKAENLRMGRKKPLRVILKQEWPFHAMLIIPVILVFIFSYIPMAGIAIAFEDFDPFKGVFGSEWVGWDNYRYILMLPDTFQILYNTVFIALWKIVLNLAVPIIVSLLLNELKCKKFVRSVQTIIYLPHFVSWVILAGVFIDILSPSNGIVNKVLNAVGIDSIFFLGDPACFPGTMIVTDVWKSFGYGTIVYLAALTGINPELYEAAKIDGANRFKQTWHVTLPGMVPIIVLMTLLSLGNVLNAGFDQIYNLLSPTVFETGDIIDTFVYRMGMIEQQYSISTAVSTFKSIVSFVLISISYFLADKCAGYRIF